MTEMQKMQKTEKSQITSFLQKCKKNEWEIFAFFVKILEPIKILTRPLRLRPQVYRITGLTSAGLRSRVNISQVLDIHIDIFQPSHEVVLSCWALVNQLSLPTDNHK
jgi:hypothetical protein